MKVQLSQLIASRNALSTLIAIPLPIKTAYWLSKVGKAVQLEINQYDEIRNQLIVKLGVEDEKEKGRFTVPEDKMEEFAAELNPVLAVEVEFLPNFGGLSIDELGADSKVSASVISQLEWLFKE